MSDITRARDASIAAETRVEHCFELVLDKLHALNSRLAQLNAAIKAAQPVASGSVCLELYPCGPGCTGCPHPRWMRYKWTEDKGPRPGMLMGTNLDAHKKDPVLALARRTPHYAPTVELIREAKGLIKDRAALLAAVRSLKYAAKVVGDGLGGEPPPN